MALKKGRNFGKVRILKQIHSKPMEKRILNKFGVSHLIYVNMLFVVLHSIIYNAASLFLHTYTKLIPLLP